MLLDVTDLIKDYPNITANVSKQQMADCEFLGDGRYYAKAQEMGINWFHAGQPSAIMQRVAHVSGRPV